MKGKQQFKQKRKDDEERPRVQNKIRRWNELKLNEFHQRVHRDQRKPAVKKQIRDINRLLQREQMPEEIKQKKQGDLLNLKKTLRVKRKEKFQAQKYKNIRFVEEKKVKRKLNQVEKKISACEDEEEMETLRAEKAKWIDNLHYIKHFPEGKKYIALFAKNDEDGEEAKEKNELLIEDLKKEIREKAQTVNEKRIHGGVKRSKAEKREDRPDKKDDFFADELQPDEESGVQREKVAKKIVNRKGIIVEHFKDNNSFKKQH